MRNVKSAYYELAYLLIEQQQATLAALNAALSRPTDTPVEHPDFPAALTHAAVAPDAHTIRFTANTLGAPVGDSPLPPLAELEALASEHSPEVRSARRLIKSVLQFAWCKIWHPFWAPILE